MGLTTWIFDRISRPFFTIPPIFFLNREIHVERLDVIFSRESLQTIYVFFRNQRIIIG